MILSSDVLDAIRISFDWDARKHFWLGPLAREPNFSRRRLCIRDRARWRSVSCLFVGWSANDDRHPVYQRPGQGLRLVDRDGELQMRCRC